MKIPTLLLTVGIIATAGTLTLPAPASAAPQTGGAAVRKLRELAATDPEVKSGIDQYDRLPASEKKKISDYLDSDQFNKDFAALHTGNSAGDRLEIAPLETSANSLNSLPRAAGTTWFVSREYTMKFRIPKTRISVYKYWHRLHYNHNGRSVTGTRSCDGDVSGWTGGWSIEKNEARSTHYARGGLGFCNTYWKWKWFGKNNWTLNSNTRWSVNYQAIVVFRESTPAQ